MEISYPHISPSLQQYVAGMWASKAHETVSHERIVPDGGSTLIFNFGDAITARSEGSVQTWKGNFFAGPATTYVDLKYTGCFEQVGIIFKPFGAFQLLKVPMSEFSNDVVELELIDKHKFQRVFETMAAADSIKQRLTIAYRWLEESFASTSVESFVPQVTSLLHAEAEISMSEIAYRIGKSQQHVARLFNKYAGINPKKLQRIFRFQKALQALSTQRNLLLTSAAYQFNYFDQPHFNNEIKSFSGFTPSQLAQQNVLGSLRVIR